MLFVTKGKKHFSSFALCLGNHQVPPTKLGGGDILQLQKNLLCYNKLSLSRHNIAQKVFSAISYKQLLSSAKLVVYSCLSVQRRHTIPLIPALFKPNSICTHVISIYDGIHRHRAVCGEVILFPISLLTATGEHFTSSFIWQIPPLFFWRTGL